MYSNVCVKVALCLTLIASIEGRVLRFHQVQTSNKGELHLRQSTTTLKSNIVELKDNTQLTMPEEDSNKEKNVVTSIPEYSTNVKATLEDRTGITANTCPKGYTRSNGMCVKDDEDY